MKAPGPQTADDVMRRGGAQGHLGVQVKALFLCRGDQLIGSVFRKDHGEFTTFIQTCLGDAKQGAQRQRVVVAGQISLPVFALGMAVKERWIADHEIHPSVPSLSRQDMHFDAVCVGNSFDVVLRLLGGLWFELNGVDFGLGKALRQHERQDSRPCADVQDGLHSPPVVLSCSASPTPEQKGVCAHFHPTGIVVHGEFFESLDAAS